MSVAAQLLADLTDDELAAFAERITPLLESSGSHQSESLLSADEAARKVKLHPRTIVRAAREGRVVGAIRQGRSWRFRADELEVLPPAGVTPAPPPPPRSRQRTAVSGAAAAIRGQTSTPTTNRRK